MPEDILQRDGLSISQLEMLSYRSELGIKLKENLNHFDKNLLFVELNKVTAWYDKQDFLHNCALDYRIKSLQSIRLKYTRYWPDHQLRKVFNDILGFRSLCDNYESVLALSGLEHIRIADLSHGKAEDDGYRGVHAYFQLSSYHYPIEIQYNTYYDRQINNWLHKYLYKKYKDSQIGFALRKAYESGRIRTEEEFKEALKHVLFSGKKI